MDFKGFGSSNESGMDQEDELLGECFKCGISSEKVRLFDGVSRDGVVRLCVPCSREESIPIIKKPTTFQLKSSEKKGSVYERLSRASGFGYSSKEEFEKAKKEREDLKKEEVTLRSIINKNLKIKTQFVSRDNVPRVKLIENFHWIIMRRRRERKLTISQLADSIGESEISIKMIEQGKLPEDDYRLVNKLENYLSIRISKEGADTSRIPIREEVRKNPLRAFDFRGGEVNDLKIADLQRIKMEKEMRASSWGEESDGGNKMEENSIKEESLSEGQEDLDRDSDLDYEEEKLFRGK